MWKTPVLKGEKGHRNSTTVILNLKPKCSQKGKCTLREEIQCHIVQCAQAQSRAHQMKLPRWSRKQVNKHQLRKETHGKAPWEKLSLESCALSRRQPCQPSPGLHYWPMQHMIPTSSAFCSFLSSPHSLILPFRTSELPFFPSKGEPRSDQGFSWLTQSSNTPFLKKQEQTANVPSEQSKLWALWL